MFCVLTRDTEPDGPGESRWEVRLERRALVRKLARYQHGVARPIPVQLLEGVDLSEIDEELRAMEVIGPPDYFFRFSPVHFPEGNRPGRPSAEAGLRPCRLCGAHPRIKNRTLYRLADDAIARGEVDFFI